MTKLLKTGVVAASMAWLSAGMAAAQTTSGTCSIWRPWNCLTSGGSTGGTSGSTGGTTASVPEIDASAGLLALAAVVVVMLFVWERKRRSV